jgi:hypothetical protein
MTAAHEIAWSSGHGDADGTRIGRCPDCGEYVYSVYKLISGSTRSVNRVIVDVDHRPHDRTCAGRLAVGGAR